MITTKFSNHETSNALKEYSRCKEKVMSKVTVTPWHAYMQEQKAEECIASNPFATSVLERDGGQHHTPAALLPWKSRYHCTGHRVGLRAGNESPPWAPFQVFWVRTSVCLPRAVIPFALFSSVSSDQCQDSILTRATTLTTHVYIFISLDAIKHRPFKI